MSGVVPRTGQVSMSCINSVRRCKPGQQGRIVENPNTYLTGSQSFYRSKAAMRCFNGEDDVLKFSEFKAAQVITACMRSYPESNGGRYGTINDGRIDVCVVEDTINTNGGNRYYGYRLNQTGGFQICTNNNCKQWTGLEGGGSGICNVDAGGAFRDYCVEVKDNTLGANIRKSIRLYYGTAQCTVYSCVQSKDDLNV